MKTAVIGCGNLGKSLATGFLKKEVLQPKELSLTRRHHEELADFKNQGVNVGSNNHMAVQNADVVILALKPYNILTILEELKDELSSNSPIIISVATGTEIRQIEEVLDQKLPIYRVMPNIAAGIGESITVICSKNSNAEDDEKVLRLFNAIGLSIFVEEDLMEAATIMGACGIAYVMRFIRAMVQGGIEIGFDAKTASAIVNQAVRGASGLLLEHGSHPESEIDKVTTPKGCTIVGLNEMEHNGFSSALIKGIVSSFKKIQK